MTCIVAVRSGGRVFMGADSLAVYGDDIIAHTGLPKLWRPTPWIGMGVSGDALLHAWAKFSAEFPEKPFESEDDAHRWFAMNFVTQLRAFFSDINVNPLKPREGVEPRGSFLFGTRGAAFVVSAHTLEVIREDGDYLTIGIGSEMAAAALYTLRDKPPEERVRAALETAAALRTDVGPPFLFDTIES
jgi:hypothetical protein